MIQLIGFPPISLLFRGATAPNGLLLSTLAISADYIVGITDGEGNFTIEIPTKGSLRVKFRIGQHKASKSLLYAIKDYFKCGSVISGGGHGTMLTYQVTSIKDIVNIIIPFFEAHPLLSSKIYNYSDFKTVALMIFNKEHLTDEGLKIIKDIASRINTKRIYGGTFH